MKTNIIKYILLLVAGIFTTSCNGWLDLKPVDKITGPDLFKTEQGTMDALNGIYYKMAQNDVYGQALTNTTVECLSNVYAFESSTILTSKIAQFNYLDEDVRKVFNNNWSKTFNTVLDINRFIEYVEVSTAVKEENKKIMLGEVYGLRAFIHFDMLRLYGPVYKEDPSAKSIPYYTEPKTSKEQPLQASEVISKIKTDIEKALELLANDKVRQNGWMSTYDNDPMVDYYRHRNMRFNYFAAKMLKARVLLYEGKKTEAGALAKEIFAETESLVPFVHFNELTKTTRITPEVFFGIDNRSYFRTGSSLFNEVGTRGNVLAVGLKRLQAVFNLTSDQDISISDDKRIALWKEYYGDGSVEGESCMLSNKFKYKASTDAAYEESRYLQPLMRKSELFYIIAECDDSFDPINIVRKMRGVQRDLDENETTVINEIVKEYIRELHGEGQLFFFYKRHNVTSIVDGKGNNVSMDKTKYIVPLPEAEIMN